MKKTFLLFSLIFLFTVSLSAQEKFITTPYQNPYKGNNTNDYNDVSGLRTVKEKTQEQINLENQINTLRQSNNVNRNEIEKLNYRLDEINGNVVQPVMNYGGTFTQAQNNPPFNQEDNIGNTRIYSSVNTVKAMATFTEQVGATAGKIWLLYAYSANTSSPDTIKIVYSTNGGINYYNYGTLALGGTDKVNYDDLDIEIIENAIGDKYLWCTYGLRASGGTGNWFAGGFNLNITNFGGVSWVLNWPGNVTAHRYYDVKLTSDNAHYPSLAYIYIVCSFDSTDGASNHYNTQKYARCVNPYLSTAPTFSYLPTNFWWHNNGSPVLRNLNSDIAYFKHGDDSIIVSYSGLPDTTRIFFAKCNMYGNPPTEGHYQAGTESTAQKLQASLSSNGNDNGSVMCVFNQYLGTNRIVKYFRSSNFGDFTAPVESGLFGSATSLNYQPSIVGKRNGNIHLFAFNTVSSSDTVHYVSVTTSGLINQYTKPNYTTSLSGTLGAKPGFRFVAGDSCLVFYSELGPTNVWAAAGCSGSVIGVGNQNQIPFAYSLSQNYPNPFNPSTTIQYSLAKNGLVKITVYDILGKEVATLVNEVKTAGNYIIDFNGSSLSSGIYFYKISSGDFSSVKKMLMIK